MQVVPEPSLYNIFSNVEVLINCNKEMLKLLEPKIAEMEEMENENVLIGECFTVLVFFSPLHSFLLILPPFPLLTLFPFIYLSL